MPVRDGHLVADVSKQRLRVAREDVAAGRVLLRDGDELVGGDVGEHLEAAVGPHHGQRIDSARAAEAKMRPRIDRRLEAPGRHHLGELMHAVAGDHNLRPDPGGVPAHAAQRDREKVRCAV